MPHQSYFLKLFELLELKQDRRSPASQTELLRDYKPSGEWKLSYRGNSFFSESDPDSSIGMSLAESVDRYQFRTYIKRLRRVRRKKIKGESGAGGQLAPPPTRGQTCQPAGSGGSVPARGHPRLACRADPSGRRGGPGQRTAPGPRPPPIYAPPGHSVAPDAPRRGRSDQDGSRSCVGEKLGSNRGCSTCRRACWMNRSTTVGIPSDRATNAE